MAKKRTSLIPKERIEQSILLIRGHKVMLDSDLAAMYGMETKALTQAVKRNIDRFPKDSMFQLNSAEFATLLAHPDRSCAGRNGFGNYRRLFSPPSPLRPPPEAAGEGGSGLGVPRPSCQTSPPTGTGPVGFSGSARGVEFADLRRHFGTSSSWGGRRCDSPIDGTRIKKTTAHRLPCQTRPGGLIMALEITRRLVAHLNEHFAESSRLAAGIRSKLEGLRYGR